MLGPKYKFAKHGQSGAEISELLPHTAAIADDLCIVKSMVTDAFNHAPAQIFMSTGSQRFGRSRRMGSWVTYGLGSENRDLPGFVVFSTGKKGASGGANKYGCGFLPTSYAGVPFRRASVIPCSTFRIPEGVDDSFQRDTIEGVRSLNQKRLGLVGDPEIATRIGSYELAYRMQQVAPEAIGPSTRRIPTPSRFMAPSPAKPRMRTPASPPAVSSNAGCVSCRSITRPGTTMAASPRD